jgi:glycine oxidase
MNIAIAGAGLVGRVVALNLLRTNPDIAITFFDKDSKEGVSAAGFTAAGMLAPYAELETAESVIFDLGHRSIALWPSLLREIGLFDGYQQKGTLITAHPQDMGELEHFIGMLQRKVDAEGKIQTLGKPDIEALESDLYTHQRGFYIPDEGVVDAQRFMAFSVNYFDRYENVTFREYTPVEKIEAGRVHTKKGVETFDWVFDTRGLGAKEYFKELRGVRGEVLWVEANDIDISRPTRLMHPRYKLKKYYRVTVEGRVAAAQLQRLRDGVELEDGFARPERAAIMRSSATETVMEIILREGRNRQVRRMAAAIGCPVKKLVRTRIGCLRLGSLPKASYRFLSDEESAQLRQMVGLH